MVVSSQGRWGRCRCSRPEKAASLIGCGGQCAERAAAAHRQPYFRHNLNPPAHCRHTPTAHPRELAAIMSDNDNGNDNGEEMVTKPFKFVTGELCPRLRYL
jgi:hypothetical protein